MINLSGTLNVGRLFYNPALCLPHLAVPSFDKIPLPIQFPNHDVTIRGVVLDKDNCFAKDQDDKVWPAYSDTWKQLQSHFPKEHLLIVSNSAGTTDDPNFEQAEKLESDTGVTVLRHPTKKPGCHAEVLDYFQARGIHNPQEIVVIGDRLFTDMLLANMMGSWGIWLHEGVELSNSLLSRGERRLYSRLVTSRDDPFVPPTPKI